jgi:hypothetical protein
MKAIRLGALGAVSLVPAMACSYSATAAAVGAGGGEIAIQIYTQPGCEWQAAPTASWMSIYSGRAGNGTGTVYVYVQPNRGFTRVGNIDVLVQEPSNNIGGRSGGGSTIATRASVNEY